MKPTLGAALIYPYRKRNILASVIIPGLLLYPTVATGVGVQAFKGVPLLGMMFSLADFVVAILTLAAMVGILGFQWHLQGKLNGSGLDAEMPSWKTNWKAFLKDGWKALIFFLFQVFEFGVTLVFAVAMLIIIVKGPEYFHISLSKWMIGVLVMAALFLVVTVPFFMGPFTQASVITSSQSRRIRSMFDAKKNFKATFPRYWYVIYANILIMVMGLVYLLLHVVTCFTVVLIEPFLNCAMLTSGSYLLVQGFDYHEEVKP